MKRYLKRPMVALAPEHATGFLSARTRSYSPRLVREWGCSTWTGRPNGVIRASDLGVLTTRRFDAGLLGRDAACGSFRAMRAPWPRPCGYW